MIEPKFLVMIYGILGRRSFKCPAVRTSCPRPENCKVATLNQKKFNKVGTLRNFSLNYNVIFIKVGTLI